jgi:DNA recombination protein RmuC
MDGMLLASLLALAAGVFVLAVVLVRMVRSLRAIERADPAPALLPLQAQLEALREQVRASLDGNRQELDRRLEETQRVVGEVRRSLGAVDEQVRSVGVAARDLRSLQELLRAPKPRGALGEYLLSELLAQVLPHASFALQHEFAGGERVDAVLRIGERIVPVDAKFRSTIFCACAARRAATPTGPAPKRDAPFVPTCGGTSTRSPSATSVRARARTTSR